MRRRSRLFLAKLTAVISLAACAVYNRGALLAASAHSPAPTPPPYLEARAAARKAANAARAASAVKPAAAQGTGRGPATLELQVKELQRRLQAEEKSMCVGGEGSWQERIGRIAANYNTELKKQGSPKPRSIVYRCRKDLGDSCGGLGDSLAGLLSAFVVALRSNRMFFVDWVELRVAFEPSATFAAPDWQYTPERVGISKAVDEAMHNKRKPIGHGHDVQIHGNGDVAIWSLASTVFSGEHPGARGGTGWEQFKHRVTVMGIGNRASTYRMTHDNCPDDPQKQCERKGAAEELKTLGFTLTARDHGCILRFLFSPTPRLWTHVAQYAAALTAPGIYTVGMHVRVRYNKTRASVSKIAQPFISCADNLTKARPRPKDVRWFIASDVAAVSNEVTRLRPDHMLNASATMNPCHIGTPACVSGCKIKSGVVKEMVKACSGMDDKMDVFAEWLMLSLTDTTISFGPDTGYSKGSTAYSLHLLADTYVIDHVKQRGPCTPHHWGLHDDTTWM